MSSLLFSSVCLCFILGGIVWGREEKSSGREFKEEERKKERKKERKLTD